MRSLSRLPRGLQSERGGYGGRSVFLGKEKILCNVVSIIGYSEAPEERIGVMGFDGVLTLEFYLQESSDGVGVLDWGKRVKIAAGIEYLHEVMTPHIVHGCFKPSNILIDVKFVARISDYGLQFGAPRERAKGVVGYVDKEYWVESKGACKESDVYGFWEVLLELLSGKKNEEGLIVEWALPLIKEMRFGELSDSRVVIPTDHEPLCRLATVALACVANSRKSRPSIVQVAAILNSLEMDFSP